MAVKRCWLLAGCWLALFALLCAAPSLAQAPQVPTPRVQNGKKLFALNGKATPLFWAFGLAQTTQLDDYKESGFNTLVIPVTWENTPDGALAPGDLKATRGLAEAAARRGLWIIYQLPAAPSGLEHSLHLSAESQSYSALWSNWTAGAIEQLGDTPRLLGWMLPDDPRSLPLWNNDGFAKWLTSNYASVEVLNAQWNTKFTALDTITIEAAASLAAQWQKTADLEVQTPERFGNLPLPPGLNSSSRGWAFHPAALSVALYKWDAYRALLTFWAGTVRGVAPEAPLFSGRLPDYAQMLSLPAVVDVSLPDVAPSVGEADTQTHNPHAVSIARRAGRFAAIPTLSTNGTPTLPAADLPRLCSAWIDAALAHGASGLAFASWSDLQRNALLRRTITANLQRVQAPPFSALWNQAPHSSAAVMLTPLAEGLSVQQAAPTAEEERDDAGRGLYGFGDDLVSGEPSKLAFALRWGTAFGAVDFLAPDDVLSNDVDLLRYNTLLCPQALSVSDALAQRLTRYAVEGGLLVADLGIGAAQAGGKVNDPSPALLALFGLSATPQLRRDEVNLQLLTPSPLLPSWNTTQPGAWLTSSAGRAAFAGPILMGQPRPGTIALAATRTPRRTDEPGDMDNAAYLTFKAQGAGGAIFAPMRFWERWLPGQLGFDGFHGDLFGRGALVVQSGASSFAPLPNFAPMPGTVVSPFPPYPETVNFPDAIALLNHTPPLTPEMANEPDFIANPNRDWCQLLTSAPGEWLWTNVVTAFSPANAAPAPGATRLAPAADEERPQLVALHALTLPGAMLVTKMAPVRIRHLTGGPVMARLLALQSDKAALALWPNATAFTPQGGTFTVTPGETAGVRAIIFDSPDYRVAPGSRHRVTVTTLALPAAPQITPPVTAPVNPKAKPKKEKTPPKPPEPTIPPPTTQDVQADAQGRLTIDATGAALMLEIVPVGS